MKIILWTLGLTSLFLIFSVFQVNHNSYLRAADHIKEIGNDSAAGALSYFDEEAYAEGLMEIRDEDALKYIVTLLSEGITSGDAHETKNIKASVTIFDDQEIVRKYKLEDELSDGEIEFSSATCETRQVNYSPENPIFYKDELTGKEVIVDAPSILVSVKAEGEYYNLTFLPEPGVVTFSKYEVKGW